MASVDASRGFFFMIDPQLNKMIIRIHTMNSDFHITALRQAIRFAAVDFLNLFGTIQRTKED